MWRRIRFSGEVLFFKYSFFFANQGYRANQKYSKQCATDVATITSQSSGVFCLLKFFVAKISTHWFCREIV